MQRGDWIVGHEPVSRGNKLVYAMKISEVIDFDDYFSDIRFEYKKPRRGGDWLTQCGDNIYHRERGEWKQEWSPFHKKDQFRQDTKYPKAFIAEEFFYFGENAPPIPSQFSEIICRSQGCRCSYSPALVRAFLEWLQNTYPPGMHGFPRDREQPGNGGLIPLKAKRAR